MPGAWVMRPMIVGMRYEEYVVVRRDPTGTIVAFYTENTLYEAEALRLRLLSGSRIAVGKSWPFRPGGLACQCALQADRPK